MTYIHIVWTLLHIVFFMLALRFWLTHVETFSGRFGSLPTGILFLVLANMCVRITDNHRPVNSQPVVQSGLAVPDTLSYPSTMPVLYDVQLFRISGYWRYIGTGNLGAKKIAFHTIQSGFSTGAKWHAEQSVVAFTPSGDLRYTVAGTLTWCLFGIPCYRQRKVFTGEEKPSIL